MSIKILQTICKLKSVNISKSVLNITVNDQLHYSKELSTKMESISKS